MRDGWIYEPAPGGGFTGFRADARPSIKRNHIDGPLLTMRNGRLHWLTWRERIALRFGWTDAERLEAKYQPHLAA